MVEINEAKAIIQNEAKLALRENNGSGIVAIATGGGKSKVAIDYIAEEEEIQGRQLSVALIVPTKKLRDVNWRDEYQKWEKMEAYSRLDRYCYASIAKVKGKKYDVVILDELQNITEANSIFFQNNLVETVIGLSATPPTEVIKREILRKLGLRVVYTLTLDEAVERGVASPFEVVFLEIEALDDTIKYVKAGGKNRYWATTEKKHYDYLSSQISKAEVRGNYRAVKFFRLERMRLIYNLMTKKNVAKYYLENNVSHDERTLIFAGSIEMAESLESNTFHSSTNDKAYFKFKNEEINRLSVVKSMNEGENIENLDNAFVEQVNSKERHLIQKIGRTVRWRPNHIAKVIIVYVKGTVDEEWVGNATANIDTSNVRRLTFKVNAKS